jgi:acetylornithine aminotransferase/acetylornithine/N-succinyldiaminopimelate aminotransferase
MLAKDAVAAAFKPGDHASTFGGNPLATAAGCAVFDVMLEKGFLPDVQERALYFKNELQKLADKYQTGEAIRGLGFLLGWPIERLGSEIVSVCREKGLLINFAGGKALRFVPPLNVTVEEIDEAIRLLDQVFSEVW